MSVNIDRMIPVFFARHTRVCDVWRGKKTGIIRSIFTENSDSPSGQQRKLIDFYQGYDTLLFLKAQRISRRFSICRNSTNLQFRNYAVLPMALVDLTRAVNENWLCVTY